MTGACVPQERTASRRRSNPPLREGQRDRIFARGDAQLPQYRRDVMLDRLARHEQARRDIGIAEVAGEHRQDLALARGQAAGMFTRARAPPAGPASGAELTKALAG